MNNESIEQLKQLKAELAASLAHEKTVKVAPPTGSWDRWPQGWMDRRNYVVGLRHRRWDRMKLRRKITQLQAQIAATSERSVKRGTWTRMKRVSTRIRQDRDGNLWTFERYNGDFCCVIKPVTND
jgi:hypothetical protein